jgi:hypothetical protein
MSGNVTDTLVEAFTTPGQDATFYVNGGYFELIDCPDPVNIEFMNREGGVVGQWRGVSQGTFGRIDFAWIRILSPTVQTVRAMYGPTEVGTRRSSGSVTLAAPVALDAATLNALEFIDLNTSSLNVLTRPLLPVASYAASTVLAANVAQAVFLAAANVNGAIIHAAAANDAQATAGVLALVAKATTPANAADGEVIAQAAVLPGASSNYLALDLKNPTRIPPGVGLYFIGSQAGVAAATLRSCRYTLL